MKTDWDWETNSEIFEKIKFAKLISAFVEGEKIRLFFEKDGKIFRLKVWCEGFKLDEIR